MTTDNHDRLAGGVFIGFMLSIGPAFLAGGTVENHGGNYGQWMGAGMTVMALGTFGIGALLMMMTRGTKK